MALVAPPLMRHLAGLGIAREDDPLLDALVEVAGRRLSMSLGPIGTLPSPLPAVGARFQGRLSPRCALLLLKALDVRRGDRVLLAGDPLVYLAAALDALPPSARPSGIVLASPQADRAKRSLQQFGLDTHHETVRVVRLQDPADMGRFDRVLLMGVPWETVGAGLVADEAVVLQVGERDRRPTLVQRIYQDGVPAELDLSSHRFLPTAEPADEKTRARFPRLRRVEPERGLDAGRIMLLERLHADVWRGRAPSGLQQEVADVVLASFRDGPHDPELGDADTATGRSARLARRVFHLAYLEQMAGDLGTSEALYRASIEVLETAEAWTFYGWVRSLQGRMQDAIDACRRAIQQDPGFGNPYNDIGAYLIELGRPDAAKPWLHRATEAPRYAAPYFSYLNLARIYLAEGDLDQARDAAQHALDVAPGYPPAERLLDEIEAREAQDPSQR